MRPVPVETARVGDTALRGRPSKTRAEWEAAREADAADLNRLLVTGGTVNVYVVPLWSNHDAERCLRELQGFDEARVYVELAPDEGQEEALAAIAEAEWAGVACSPLPSGGEGVGGEGLANLIHAAASLDLPLLLPDVDPALALRTLALAIAEDLSPREIEAVLRGERTGEPDAESLGRARDLLG